MRGIATDAGLTTRALYNYVESKAALFELVWRDSVERIYTDYADVVAGKDSLVEEVEALLDRSRDLLREDPEHVQFSSRLLVEKRHDELAHLDLQVGLPVEFFTQMARRAVERGELAPPEARTFMTFIVTQLWGIQTVAMLDESTIDATVDAAQWAVRRNLTGAAPTPGSRRRSPRRSGRPAARGRRAGGGTR